MAKLYDINDNLLAKAIQVQPQQQPIKIEHNLLSGQLDVQIIGTPEDVYEVRGVMTYASMLTVQDAAAQGTSVKLEQEGTTYTCYIKEMPSFRLRNIGIAANRYYEGVLTLSVIS